MPTVLGELVVKLKADFREFKGQIKTVSAELKKGEEGFKAIGQAATVAAGVIAVAMGKAVGTAATFEKGMAKLGAVSNTLGTKHFEDLKKRALEMSSTTQFTANEVVEGMNFMAMAGQTAGQIMEGIPSVLDLAAAATMDLGSASDIVTNIMAGFGMQAKDLAGANDVLVRTITGANVDIRQLGEAFKYAGPIAKSAGVSFKEASAFIGLLGNVGIQGSMAGTSLRGAIQRLLNPTSEAEAIMKKWGLQVTDSSGRLLALDKIITQLEPHAEDTAGILELFGLRAGPGTAALVGQGGEAITKFIDRLNTSGVTAKGVADAQMNTLWGAMKTIGSQFERISIELADNLLPLFRGLADSVIRVANAFISLGPTTKAFIAFGTLAAGVLSGLVAAFAGVAVLIPSMVKGFIAIKAALGIVAGFAASAFAALSAFVAPLVSALAALPAAFATVIAPLGVVAAGIIAIGASIWELWLFYADDIERKWTEAVDGIRKWFSSVFNRVTSDVGDATTKWWVFIRDWATDALSTAAEFLNTFADWIWSLLPDAFKGAFKTIASEAKSLFDWMGDTINWLTTRVSDFATKWVAYIKEAVATITGIFSTAVDFWKEKLGFGGEAPTPSAPAPAAQSPEQKEVVQETVKTTKAIVGLGTETEKLTKKTKKAEDGLDGLGGAFVEATQKIDDLGLAISPIGAGRVSAGQMMEPAMPAPEFSAGPGIERAKSAVTEGWVNAGLELRQSMLDVGKMVAMTFVEGGEQMSAAMQGAIQGAQVGGPWGAIIGALLGLAKQTKAFGNIVKVGEDNLSLVTAQLQQLLSAFQFLINQVGQTFQFVIKTSNILGQFGTSMQVLSWVMDKVGMVVGRITDGLTYVWNWLMTKLANLASELGLDSFAKALRDARIEITRTVYDAAETFEAPGNPFEDAAVALSDVAESASALNDELLNAPEGFKVAQRRFEATAGEAGMPGVGAAGGMNIGTINVDATDALSFWEQLKTIIEEQNYAQRGTTLDAGTAFSVANNGA